MVCFNRWRISVFHARQVIEKYDISNSGLTNNSVYYVYPDSIGRLWIGTNIGLFLMDIETGKIRFDCFDSSIKSEIIYIMSDSKRISGFVRITDCTR